MQRIVVGIDGSDGARRALRWALEEAVLRHAQVEVVHAWHLPYVSGDPFIATAFDPALYEDTARTLLDNAVDREDTSGLVAPPERTLVCGSAASALLQSAKAADLVVVGSRGLGGFTGLLLGSVSHQVAHHADCPAVVVPEQ